VNPRITNNFAEGKQRKTGLWTCHVLFLNKKG